MERAEKSWRDSPSKCEDLSDSVGDFGQIADRVAAQGNFNNACDDDSPSRSLKQVPKPFDDTKLDRDRDDGASHPVAEFSYYIEDLPIKRNILRDVDLEELVDLEYVTEGSSSHVFSALWMDEQVIVKVIVNDRL